MGAGKSAKNTSNAPKFICPSPKDWDFDEKRLQWASIVRGFGQRCTEGPRIVGTPVHTFWFTLLQKWGHATEHALWRGIFETINYFQTRE